MASTFKFELVSPERVLMSADVDQVVVPGTEGDFTVLVGHAPVVATIRPGVIKVSQGTSAKQIFIRGGFAEVEPDRLTILAARALETSAADAGALGEELASAEAALAAAKDDDARWLAERAIAEIKGLQSTARA